MLKLSQTLASVYQTKVTGNETRIAEVEKRATVTLKIHDLKKQPLCLPTSNINATLALRFEKDQLQVKQCSITELDRGKYEIAYQPDVAEPHHLHINVNGKPVKGSPFYVRVVQSFDKTLVRSIAGLNGPRGVAVNYDGEIFVSESDSKCVSIFSPTGEKLRAQLERTRRMVHLAQYVVSLWIHVIRLFYWIAIVVLCDCFLEMGKS